MASSEKEEAEKRIANRFREMQESETKFIGELANLQHMLGDLQKVGARCDSAAAIETVRLCMRSPGCFGNASALWTFLCCRDVTSTSHTVLRQAWVRWFRTAAGD